MKVLLTGANGQVAYDFIQQSAKKTILLAAMTKAQLDITNFSQVQKIIENFQPDVVVNAAAYTQVDKAEEEIEKAFAVNRDGAKNLAIACEEKAIPLIHLSTDYIFDGKKTAPYVETDSAAPLNVYGKSKWEGEEALRQYCTKHIILRVSAVFGVHGANFVKTIARLAREKTSLRIVSDQITCPTPAAAIADMLWQLCEKFLVPSNWGTYHFCGNPPISWYDFAKEIVAELKQHTVIAVKNIEKVSSVDYITPAERPLHTILDNTKLKIAFAIEQANWKNSLKNIISLLSK